MNISTVDIICLYNPNKPERRMNIENMLGKLDLNATYVSGTDGAVPTLISIFSERLTNWKPFILMEDDCSYTEWFTYSFSCPENTDGVFIGISPCSTDLNKEEDNHVWKFDYENVTGFTDIVKINNMLSTHAFYIHSERWCKHLIELWTHINETYIKNGTFKHYDVPIARTMRNFNIYALRFPMFYQDPIVGGQGVTLTHFPC